MIFYRDGDNMLHIWNIKEHKHEQVPFNASIRGHEQIEPEDDLPRLVYDGQFTYPLLDNMKVVVIVEDTTLLLWNLKDNTYITIGTFIGIKNVFAQLSKIVVIEHEQIHVYTSHFEHEYTLKNNFLKAINDYVFFIPSDGLLEVYDLNTRHITMIKTFPHVINVYMYDTTKIVICSLLQTTVWDLIRNQEIRTSTEPCSAVLSNGMIIGFNNYQLRNPELLLDSVGNFLVLPDNTILIEHIDRSIRTFDIITDRYKLITEERFRIHSILSDGTVLLYENSYSKGTMQYYILS